MRAVSLALLICLWCISETPAVLAGTRATVEESPRMEETQCRGWDDRMYPAGARECQAFPAETPTSPEPIDAQEAPEATPDAEAPTSQDHPWFLAASIAALIALAAAAIAAIFRTSRRAPTSTSEPVTPPPEATAQAPSAQGTTGGLPPPVTSETISSSQSMPSTPPDTAEQAVAPSVTPASAPPVVEPEDIHERPALAEGETGLVTVWTGPPCRVEFTFQDEDGDRHRRTLDVNRICRDPQLESWHLQGFCHLWRDERDYDGATIVTKILYKSRRWDLEDWVIAVAGKDVVEGLTGR